MSDPTHLTEGDYPKSFPPDLDSFPFLLNDEYYIDAWLLNSVFNSLLATEQYLIEYKANIEAPIGGDVLGVEGELEIAIPPARYPAYKFTLAWDADLLDENIKSGITIFGILGTLIAGAGGVAVSLPLNTVIPFIYPAAMDLNTSHPDVSIPTVTVV